jgi:glycosyltransferase involved in cell wall biosynthesis
MTNVVRSADAVIARLPSELGFIACSVARKLKKPLLVEVVGSAGEALRTHGSHIARAYAPVAERRMRRAVASSQFVTYVTKQWLQRCYPSPNPPLGEDDSRAQARVADVVIESPGSDVVEARKRRLDRLEQGGVPVFGTIASLAVGYKGLQLAIPAFGELKREGFTFIYRILGPGNPEPWQRLIDRHGLSDCCFLDGARPSGQPVLDWLDAIDVHVQPSLTESLGRAQIEAMSRGVACVSSNAGGLGEYGSPEWQHPPGDRAALTTLLRRVLENPCLVAGMSAAAFQAAKQFEPAALEPERSRMMALLARAARHG